MTFSKEMQEALDSIEARKEEIIEEREYLKRSKHAKGIFSKGFSYGWNSVLAPRGNVLLSMGRITTKEDTEKAIERMAKNRTTAAKELKKWNSKFVW